MSRIIRKSAAYVALAGALMAATLSGAVLHATQTEAASQSQINQFIRANGGIPQCKHEDGSGQPGMCVFHGNKQGNKKGDTIVLVPTKPGHDKRVVVLINR